MTLFLQIFAYNQQVRYLLIPRNGHSTGAVLADGLRTLIELEGKSYQIRLRRDNAVRIQVDSVHLENLVLATNQGFLLSIERKYLFSN